jgi:hypothetical protein
MKRYTLRAAIHDAKIFDHLRREYRRTKKNRRKHSSSGWLSRCLAGMRQLQLSPFLRGTIIQQVARRWQHAVEVLAIVLLLR